MWPEYRSPIGPCFRNSVYKTGAESHLSSEVNMTQRWMLSASLLLTGAQANSLYPASTFPLRELNRSPRFGNEETLYTGFQPPLQSMHSEDYNDFALTRTLGKIKFSFMNLPVLQWAIWANGETKQYFSSFREEKENSPRRISGRKSIRFLTKPVVSVDLNIFSWEKNWEKIWEKIFSTTDAWG